MEEQCTDYRTEKEPLREEGQIELIQKYLNDNEYQALSDLSLTPELKEVKKLQEMVDLFRGGLADNLRYIKRMETDMRAIQARVQKFASTAVKDFYEYLQDEKDMNL